MGQECSMSQALGLNLLPSLFHAITLKGVFGAGRNYFFSSRCQVISRKIVFLVTSYYILASHLVWVANSFYWQPLKNHRSFLALIYERNQNNTREEHSRDFTFSNSPLPHFIWVQLGTQPGAFSIATAFSSYFHKQWLHMKGWRTAGIPLKLVNTVAFIYWSILLLRLCKKDRLIGNTAKSRLSFKTYLYLINFLCYQCLGFGFLGVFFGFCCLFVFS